ncbi:MAG TPA: hypothetical protein PK165_03055 [bacterium]|nr:hypothetical protein [bacterium]HPO51795.1 hypothetical protein [bacterium]
MLNLRALRKVAGKNSWVSSTGLTGQFVLKPAWCYHQGDTGFLKGTWWTQRKFFWMAKRRLTPGNY